MEKMKEIPKTDKKGVVDALFSVGAHFGFVKSRRHPSAKSFIFGSKNNIEIFDLEKTSKELEKALTFIQEKGKEGAMALWVGGKLSNFSEIKKRILRLEDLTLQKEKGELNKYTKKERLLFDREIDKLTLYFGGLSRLKSLPKFLVVVDPKKEYIAVAEAHKIHIPVVALAGSDSNLYELDYPIPGNDASRQNIGLIIKELIAAYKKGREAKEKNDNNGAN